MSPIIQGLNERFFVSRLSWKYNSGRFSAASKTLLRERAQNFSSETKKFFRKFRELKKSAKSCKIKQLAVQKAIFCRKLEQLLTSVADLSQYEKYSLGFWSRHLIGPLPRPSLEHLNYGPPDRYARDNQNKWAITEWCMFWISNALKAHLPDCLFRDIIKVFQVLRDIDRKRSSERFEHRWVHVYSPIDQRNCELWVDPKIEI